MRRRGSRAREARELVDPRARRVDGAGADGPRVRGRHAGRQHLLGPHVVVAGREALLRLADDRDDGVRRRARRRARIDQPVDEAQERICRIPALHLHVCAQAAQRVWHDVIRRFGQLDTSASGMCCH